MNFETVKKSNKPKIIIGVITLLIITSVVMFVSTRAKYKSVQSLKLDVFSKRRFSGIIII